MYPGTSTVYDLRSLNAHAFEDPRWRQLMKDADPRVLPPERPTWALFDTGESVVRSPVLDRLSVRYFVNPIRAPIVGRRVDLSSPVGEAVLRPGSPLTAPVPPGQIRGVAVRVVRGLPGSADAVLRVEILDASGRMLSGGARRIRADDPPGSFEIPVVEVAGKVSAVRSWTVRVSLEGNGQLALASDPTGRPSLSVVMGGSDGLKLVFATGVAVYERANALPRIRWAIRTRVIGDASERLRALAASVPPDTVILNEGGPAGSAEGARLRVLEDSGDQLRVQVEALGAGYLVVADAMQDGWIASIDGRPTALRPADHGLVAVFVPAGRHRVTFRYHPDGWGVGQLISVLSAVVLLALALSGWTARRLLRRG
jgi:hypothetical protein